jgi:nucleolar protein 14
MGASQLKRLKASLKDQGLVGPSNSRKKRSKRVDSRKNNEAALRSIREAFNPFDVKVNRQKHEVLGRAVQGSKGRPELTKQMEEENRRQAFRAEQYRKNKAGGILDRRFGEEDKTMTLEEKMQERFTREMQTRSSKGSLFDLDDDEDEDDGFLSYGQSLSSLKDDFDGEGLNADEDDEEIKQIRQKRMQMRDDGDDGDEEEEEEEPARKKSKQEVMKEVIAKSKMHKLERQQAKEEDLAVIEELNEDGNIEELYRELSGLNRKSQDQKKVVDVNDADYDKEVRSLAFERRAKPADRTKTTEELEKEAEEKRKELESKRLARMNGELDESSEEDEPERQKANIENDENNDAMEFGFDGSAAATTQPTDDESEPEDDFGDILEEDMPADSSSESESSDSSDSEVEDDEDKLGGSVGLDCPTSLSVMISTLGVHDIESQPRVIEKILSKYHPRYAEGNKAKQGELSKVLVDYILHLIDSDEDGLEIVLNKFVFQVRKLAETHSEILADHFREKIKTTEIQLSSKLEGSAQNYPKTSTLMTFTLIGLIFSASDHFHPVVTPAQILICQTLSQMPLRSLDDLYSGLYLCNVILAYQKLANRFVPEVVSFLGKALFSMLGNIQSNLDVQKTFLEESTSNIFIVDLNKLKGLRQVPLLLRENSKVSSSSKPQLLLEAVNTVDRFMSIWKDKTAFVEVFGSLECMLSAIQHYHPSIRQVHEKMLRIMKLAIQSRKPVMMQSHKPIPLKSLAPQFEENYNIDKKSYDPDTQRQEISKLKAQVKKERKGALRDIRKDNAFTAREHNREKRERDREYHEKLARLERSIATEEGTEKNKYEREKMARKRSKR